MQEICHRDLKLENTLLDGSPTPRVKICDFGYSKVLTWMLLVLFYISEYFTRNRLNCSCLLGRIKLEY